MIAYTMFLFNSWWNGHPAPEPDSPPVIESKKTRPVSIIEETGDEENPEIEIFVTDDNVREFPEVKELQELEKIVPVVPHAPVPPPQIIVENSAANDMLSPDLCFHHIPHFPRYYSADTVEILTEHRQKLEFCKQKYGPGYMLRFLDCLRRNKATAGQPFSPLWSCNPHVTWDIVQKCDDDQYFKWDFALMSKNINITPEIVAAHSQLPWSYAELSANPNFAWKHVMENLEAGWDYKKLSANPNITEKIMKSQKTRDWDKPTFQDACQKRKDRAQDREYYRSAKYMRSWKLYKDLCSPGTSVKSNQTQWSSCVHVTMDFIENHMDGSYRWDIDEIAQNPNVTPDMISKWPFSQWKAAKFAENLFAYHDFIFYPQTNVVIAEQKNIITQSNMFCKDVSNVICSYIAW